MKTVFSWNDNVKVTFLEKEMLYYNICFDQNPLLMVAIITAPYACALPLPHVIMMNKSLFPQWLEVFKINNMNLLGDVGDTMPFWENCKFFRVLTYHFVDINFRTSSILSNLCWVRNFLGILPSFQLQKFKNEADKVNNSIFPRGQKDP